MEVSGFNLFGGLPASDTMSTFIVSNQFDFEEAVSESTGVVRVDTIIPLKSFLLVVARHFIKKDLEKGTVEYLNPRMDGGVVQVGRTCPTKVMDNGYYALYSGARFYGIDLEQKIVIPNSNSQNTAITDDCIVTYNNGHELSVYNLDGVLIKTLSRAGYSIIPHYVGKKEIILKKSREVFLFNPITEVISKIEGAEDTLGVYNNIMMELEHHYLIDARTLVTKDSLQVIQLNNNYDIIHSDRVDYGRRQLIGQLKGEIYAVSNTQRNLTVLDSKTLLPVRGSLDSENLPYFYSEGYVEDSVVGYKTRGYLEKGTYLTVQKIIDREGIIND